MANNPRVILVDDEQNLLNGIKRQLRGTLEVETFFSAKTALAALSQPEAAAVVISDMRMPEMNGIQFLAQVQQRSPDSVRIMLTGNADQDTVVQAVNQSGIFRFLLKPCATPDLLKAAQDGIKQYKLITAEKELLQRTLSGSVKLLTEVLSLSRPNEYKHLLSKRDLLRELSGALEINNGWEIELALLLAPIGSISVPAELLEKRLTAKPLSPDEKQALLAIPSTSCKLVSHIPRLERVATFIERSSQLSPHASNDGDKRDLALQLLQAIVGIPGSNLTKVQIAAEIKKLRQLAFDDVLLQKLAAALAARERAEGQTTPSGYEVSYKELCPGQRLLSDVMTVDGRLLIAAGNQVSEALIERIRGHAKLVGIQEPILVDTRIPTAGAV